MIYSFITDGILWLLNYNLYTFKSTYSSVVQRQPLLHKWKVSVLGYQYLFNNSLRSQCSFSRSITVTEQYLSRLCVLLIGSPTGSEHVTSWCLCCQSREVTMGWSGAAVFFFWQVRWVEFRKIPWVTDIPLFMGNKDSFPLSFLF